MALMKREAIGCRRGRLLGCASAVVMWFLGDVGYLARMSFCGARSK